MEMKRFFKKDSLTKHLGIFALGLTATQAYSFTATKDQTRRPANADTLDSQLNNSSIINEGLDLLIEMLSKTGRIDQKDTISRDQNCGGGGGSL
jgi:hypothetical protein